MTQPIQEPGSSTRTDAKLTWGTNQLFRRPAPESGEPNSFAWIDHGFVGPIPSGVMTVLTVNDPFDEGAISDPDLADYEIDLALGCISWNNPGEYWVKGHLLFDDTITPGTLLCAILHLGNGCNFTGATRHGNVNVADAVTQDWRIPVSCPIWDTTGVVGFDSVRMQVYHNEGSDLNVSEAQLHVMRVTGPTVTFVT